MKIKKTPYYSYTIGKLSKGCSLCVKGKKSVFFITGICSKSCFFCPISDEKKNKDVIYINEWPTSKTKDILKEIRLCKSNSVGITGGDPLLRLGRTVSNIKLLKREFGKKFHIHMYVPLEFVTQKTLKKIADAGLDEIRFHLDIDDKKLWDRVSVARKFGWDIGVEIPVIPGKEKETRALIDFISDKVDFLNLNELEFSDTNYNRILEHNFKAKDNISYAVLGSDALAKKLLRYIEKKGYKINVHYCTAKLKDRVQLSTRIKNRSSSVVKKYDIKEKDGLLVRGAIFPDNLIPGFEYRKKINALSASERKILIRKLGVAKKKIENDFSIPSEFLGIDKVKYRILIHPNILYEIYEKLPYRCAIVKEFPTYDMFEVEVEFLEKK
ncbi:MAG: radical SAM protein [archaeon]